LILTFDDGYGNILINAIMDLLDENNAKASFFLPGGNIVGREDIIKIMAERGHEICSHGFGHLNYLKTSPWRSIADIKKGWRTIDAALEQKRGKYPFRPPYGKLNIISLLYLLINKVPIIYWTIDCGDTWETKPSCNMIAEAVKKGGAVVLAHDFDRDDEDANQYVIGSIQSALAIAKDKGMQILTVSEFLDKN
jgi:peptidoglycan/xylan/chitin deacetylase (PgdA/CDA1 family)